MELAGREANMIGGYYRYQRVSDEAETEDSTRNHQRGRTLGFDG